MLLATDPEYSFLQFIKIVEMKLLWSGYLTSENQSITFFINQKQVIASPGSSFIIKNTK